MSLTEEQATEMAKQAKAITSSIFELMIEKNVDPSVGMTAIAAALVKVMLNLGFTKEQALGGLAGTWDIVKAAEQRSMQ